MKLYGNPPSCVCRHGTWLPQQAGRRADRLGSVYQIGMQPVKRLHYGEHGAKPNLGVPTICQAKRWARHSSMVTINRETTDGTIPATFSVVEPYGIYFHDSVAVRPLPPMATKFG